MYISLVGLKIFKNKFDKICTNLFKNFIMNYALLIIILHFYWNSIKFISWEKKIFGKLLYYHSNIFFIKNFYDSKYIQILIKLFYWSSYVSLSVKMSITDSMTEFRNANPLQKKKRNKPTMASNNNVIERSRVELVNFSMNSSNECFRIWEYKIFYHFSNLGKIIYF